jgi:hypothetical protein
VEVFSTLSISTFVGVLEEFCGKSPTQCKGFWRNSQLFS